MKRKSVDLIVKEDGQGRRAKTSRRMVIGGNRLRSYVADFGIKEICHLHPRKATDQLRKPFGPRLCRNRIAAAQLTDQAAFLRGQVSPSISFALSRPRCR